jgi:mono/diheme cytochrome c family protein
MNASTRRQVRALLAALTLCGTALAGTDGRDGLIERGRDISATSGCNDCHTPGYAEHGGAVPQSQWLVGCPVGFQGPWGTTYPLSLSLSLS